MTNFNIRNIFLILVSMFLITSCVEKDAEYYRSKTKIVELSEAFTAEFSLLDVKNNVVTHENLKGKYSIIYLGFTHCESICNAALARLSIVLDNMGDSAADINPIFVGIDPNGGDTAETVNNFISFDMRLDGYYGTNEQTELLVKNLRAYVKAEDADNEEGYTVNHSSFFYILDKNAKPIFLANDDEDPISLGKYLGILVKESK